MSIFNNWMLASPRYFLANAEYDLYIFVELSGLSINALLFCIKYCALPCSIDIFYHKKWRVLVRSSADIKISMAQCKKDATPLLKHWSYVFLALTHRYINLPGLQYFSHAIPVSPVANSHKLHLNKHFYSSFQKSFKYWQCLHVAIYMICFRNMIPFSMLNYSCEHVNFIFVLPYVNGPPRGIKFSMIIPHVNFDMWYFYIHW